jgi:hypothetical protein
MRATARQVEVATSGAGTAVAALSEVRRGFLYVQ